MPRRTAIDRRLLSWWKILLWFGLVGLVLVGFDLAQRFTFYEVTKKDRGNLARLARRPVKDVLLRGMHAFPHAFEHEQDVPVFDLYLKPQDEELLRALVTRVQLIGTHDELTREWLDARLRVDGGDYDVEIKLRGRQYYHVVPPRPSLRVKLQHGRTYRSATTFNLIDPFDKTGDLAFLWESREHGLIAWDNTLGYLALRGEILGVVQYVEQPRLELSDRNGRPEGMFFRGSGEIYTEGNDPQRCGAVVERVVRWLGDTEHTITYAEMEELLDVERVRWFTALTELSGDGHGFADFNMKGYCDPVALKAEFLIWDTRFGEWSQVGSSQFAANGTQLLRCDRFRALHDRALYTLVTERIDTILARVREFYALNAERLAQDPMYHFLRGGPDGGFMRDRPEKLERTLARNAADIRAALEGAQLEWFLDGAGRVLEFATAERGSKEVTGLLVQQGDATREVALPAPVTVFGRYREHAPVVVLRLPADVEPGLVVGLVARNACSGADIAAQRRTSPPEGVRVPWDEEPPGTELPALPARFVADGETRALTLGPGEIRLSGILSLPRGWSVRVVPGTTLVMEPEAVFEIRGDASFLGTEDAPILVQATPAGPWGAIGILGERSDPVQVELRHTRVLGGAGSGAGSVRYTGSLAIYYSNARLDRLEVGENVSEDALNVKCSTLEATDCYYHDGVSDAVDYDFCTGTDRRTRIERFVNDGIDMSGSTLRVEQAFIRDVGDKGLSIGEGSTPEVLGVTVVGARTGCAVKDKSRVIAHDLTLVRPETALALYIKKEGFTPPSARFEGLLVVDAGAMLILDQGCQVTFQDSVRLGARAEDMRPFDGLKNRVEPEIAARSPLELVDLAALRRASSPGASAGLGPAHGD